MTHRFVPFRSGARRDGPARKPPPGTGTFQNVLMNTTITFISPVFPFFKSTTIRPLIFPEATSSRSIPSFTSKRSMDVVQHGTPGVKSILHTGDRDGEEKFLLRFRDEEDVGSGKIQAYKDLICIVSVLSESSPLAHA